jgi:hypothetical protein
VEAVSKCLAFSGYKAREDERAERGGKDGITEKPLEKRQNWGKTKRDRTKENFGPSTSSTSFYHHCLSLERRILDRETGEEPQNRGRLEEEKTEFHSSVSSQGNRGG